MTVCLPTLAAYLIIKTSGFDFLCLEMYGMRRIPTFTALRFHPGLKRPGFQLCAAVKPVNTKVTEFCTKLTSITPEMAASGIDFKDACSILETQFKSKEKIWTSWGFYDQRQFEYQCKESGTLYPFGDRHINLKKEYTSLYKPTKKFRGMARAMEFLDIPLVGTHHRGVDDARNISSILARMLTDYPDWGKIWESDDK